jgi:spectrin beta
MVDFQNECDRTEKWMRDKEQMLSAEDLGTDFEHCDFLQRKLNDVGSDTKFDENHLKAINALADKLSKSGVGNMEAVHDRCRELNSNWAKLQQHLDQYRNQLKTAKDLHALGNSIEDTTELLLDKVFRHRKHNSFKRFKLCCNFNFTF